jgi:hypothetical protein
MLLRLSLLVALFVASAAVGAQTSSKIGAPAAHVGYIGAVQLPSSTVAQLPLCDSYNQGILRMVTDASSPTYNGTLTGGSTGKVLALCNGTNWVGQ